MASGATAPSRIEDYQHGRVPRAVREQQLLELAEGLFAERGFAGASMDELARRAGVTKPVVYELFGSKDGLFGACVDRSIERLAAEIAAAVRSSQAELIRELMAEMAAEGTDPRELEVAAHAVNAAYEGVAHWMWEHPEVPIERIADWIADLLIPGLRRFT